MRYSEEEREIARDVNTGMRQGTKIAIGIFILCIVLSGIGWGIHVATSEVRGKGDAYAKKNSADNWTQAQKEFNAKFQEIKALDKNVNQAYVALQRTPEDQRRQIEYDGNVRNCNLAVADYNTLARSYLSEQFRDADLPAQIDDSDPETDCKENSK